MVNKKSGCMILLILLVMPLVFATTTTINVKTLAEHDVILKTLDPNPGEGNKNLLEYLEGSSDETGLASFTSHASESVINIWLVVLKNDVRVNINGKTYHEFENKATGGTITLEVKEKPPEPVVPEVNETEEVEETEEVVEEQEEVVEEIEEEKESGGIIGAIVGGGKAVVTSKITYYIIGGIFIFGVLFFVIFIAKKKLKGSAGRYVNFKLKDDKGGEIDDKIDDKDEELKDAEKKLGEVKAELDDIKNRKAKLQEAKERFERDKKELERLGG